MHGCLSSHDLSDGEAGDEGGVRAGISGCYGTGGGADGHGCAGAPRPRCKRRRGSLCSGASGDIRHDDRHGSESHDGRPPHGSDVLLRASAAETRPQVLPCHVCFRQPRVRQDIESYADCGICAERACAVCLRECGGHATSMERSESGGHERGGGGEGRGDGWGGPERGVGNASFEMRDVGEQEWQKQKRSRDLEAGGDAAWHGKGQVRRVCSKCCVERGSEGEVWCLRCLKSDAYS